MWVDWYYYPHFSDEEVEAQNGLKIPKIVQPEVPEQEFQARPPGSKASALGHFARIFLQSLFHREAPREGLDLSLPPASSVLGQTA